MVVAEAPDAPEPAEVQCEPLPFAASTPVPEASGAGWLDIDGKLALVVVSDSGNDGAYAIVDPDSGATTESGKLPLGSAGDDLEGIAVRGGQLYGLTSGGWMRVWKRIAGGFELVTEPYAIGDGDMVCGARQGNCARNYEGLCLTEDRGYALSKEDGVLYPLVGTTGKLAVTRDGAIKVDRGGVVADCAFDDRRRLWVGDNILGLSAVFRIDGWKTAAPKVVPIGVYGAGNSEVIAVRGDAMYRMSDFNNAPSLMAKFRCGPAKR